jgi:hypothetical protein
MSTLKPELPINNEREFWLGIIDFYYHAVIDAKGDRQLEGLVKEKFQSFVDMTNKAYKGLDPDRIDNLDKNIMADIKTRAEELLKLLNAPGNIYEA